MEIYITLMLFFFPVLFLGSNFNVALLERRRDLYNFTKYLNVQNLFITPPSSIHNSIISIRSLNQFHYVAKDMTLE